MKILWKTSAVQRNNLTDRIYTINQILGSDRACLTCVDIVEVWLAPVGYVTPIFCIGVCLVLWRWFLQTMLIQCIHVC